jgi:tRNA dimethylallyltransferase
MIKILVILGPTATGKSDLAVHLARKFKGEIISADSRQVYRGLNLGTGKITKKEMHGIKHHLIDIESPKKRFDVAKFVELGKKAITEIFNEGKLPIICGGTGFYIQALVDDIHLSDVRPNHKLRAKLSKKDPKELLEILKSLDPLRFVKIDKRNMRRVIRAIEIATMGTKDKPEKNDCPQSSYEPIFIGLNMSPKELRERIDIRLIKRIKTGMITEAKNLHANGLSWKRMLELGLEYRHLAKHLQGLETKEEMKEKLGIEIWHYAKRQMTWFKRDRRIKWFKPTDRQKIEKTIAPFIK